MITYSTLSLAIKQYWFGNRLVILGTMASEKFFLIIDRKFKITLENEGIKLLFGLWSGLTVGTIVEGSVYCVICYCIDWKKQVQLALERTNDVDVHDGPCLEVKVDSEDMETDNPGFSEDCSQDQLVRVDDDQSVHTVDSIFMRGTTALIRSVLASRVVCIISFICLFITCILLRIYLPWSEYFGQYCVFANGTVISHNADSPFPDNCTVVTPGQPL
ncbi:uncharacterized protein DEA37_0007634 [Paragonimus westermani]|uniref:Uncharacterized protein n=1 Tax=Paragonimus westermani TaxID=34504 RepID=A0A5J4P128_9TREM|nr:uncharacterized protein DEA37_0007634 [Paragonimus westermani]